MKVVVNLRNGEEEKVLLAFLNSLEYDYQIQQDGAGSEQHPSAEGDTSTRNWEEIKKDLLNLFN